MKNILILTATITPRPDVFLLSRKDPAERLDDYLAALQLYLGMLADGTVDGIVFAENSASELGALRSAVPAALSEFVEFISFYGLDYPQEYARVYGEFKLLDKAMAESRLVTANPAAAFWKITGRYRVTNLRRIIRSRPENFDFYCNCRNYPVRLVDQYLQAWTAEFYRQYLVGIFECFKESEIGAYGEIVMRGLLDSWVSKGARIVPRFRVTPAIEGRRGFDNADYGAGAKMKLKLLVRRICNRLLPLFWI